MVMLLLFMMMFLALSMIGMCSYYYPKIQGPVFFGSIIWCGASVSSTSVDSHYMFWEAFYMSTVSLFLITLSAWVVHMSCLLVWTQEHPAFHLTMFGLDIILSIMFVVKSLIHFYFLFELSLIPIFLIIMGWGYQPERLTAGKSMFLYTACASLPLLVLLILMSSNNPNVYGLFVHSMFYCSLNSNILSLFLILAFLVKFPLFGVHLWLPKAHVEAPVSGSIILAGILLKLGGFGVYRLSGVLSSMNFILFITSSFGLVGGSVIALACVQQTDMKVLIAYSSVGHMSWAIAGVLYQTRASCVFSVLILISHGISSSMMFLGAHVMYQSSKSRLLMLNKGLMTFLPQFSLVWALVCVANFGGPPFVNLWIELGSFMCLMAVAPSNALPLMTMGGLTAAYSLLLFTHTQSGKPMSVQSLIMKFCVQDYLVILMNMLFSVVLSFSLVKTVVLNM